MQEVAEHAFAPGLRAMPIVRDPIIQAIRNYHRGVAEFQALPDDWASPEEESAACDRTYGWALDVLERWAEPAETLEGAKAALAFAKKEINDHGGSEVAFAMLNAASGYLETI